MKHILPVLLLLLSAPLASLGQLKIGYTNVEVILAYLPEQEAISNELTAYRKKLSEGQAIKEQYFQTKYTEYAERAQTENLTEAETEQMSAELQKLQADIQKAGQDLESKMARKQSELITPLLQKVQVAIEAVAQKLGYTYVLNASSAGTSVLIHGRPEDDITLKVFTHLGIPIPEELQSGE